MLCVQKKAMRDGAVAQGLLLFTSGDYAVFGTGMVSSSSTDEISVM